jgi:hypothetical protein
MDPRARHYRTSSPSLPLTRSLTHPLQLLHGVFEECNISFTKPLCAKIAERVKASGLGKCHRLPSAPLRIANICIAGANECSAKAIESRLYSWKKKNVSGGGGTPAKTPIKTPASRGKKQKVVTPELEHSGPEGLASSDEEVVSPSMNRKRARSTPKKLYAESDQEDGEEEEGEEEEKVYIPFGKRIKAEPVEREEVFGEVEEIQEEV